MTIDKLVTTDLAALATTSRSHVLSIDGLLPAETGPDITADQTLLALGRIYAHRVARTVAGSVAVVMTFALIAALMAQTWEPGEYDLALPRRLSMFEVNTRTMAVTLLALVLASYVLALRIADRVFDQRTAGSLGRAKRLARAVDGWSVALGVAGAVAYVTLIGLAHFTLGSGSGHGDSWLFLMAEKGHWLGPAVTTCTWSILVSTAIALILAIALGRACIRRPSWLQTFEHWSVVPLGLALGVSTLYLGFALDCRPITEYDDLLASTQYSTFLRQLLTVGGVTAVFLVMTGWTLHRRRREIERAGL
jgi:hypothetical protein